MKPYLLALVVGVLIVGAIAGVAYRQYKFATDGTWKYADRLDQFSLSFFDPEAVHWRTVYMGKHNMLCGWVNGKNAMGAYIGFKPWYAVQGALVPQVVDLEADKPTTNESTPQQTADHTAFSTWHDNCAS